MPEQLMRIQNKIATVLGLVLVFLMWIFAASLKLIDPIFLPGPLSVLRSGAKAVVSPGFWEDLSLSCMRICAGFIIAAIFALPIGTMMGRMRNLDSFFGPPISFIRFVPMPAVIPLLILWFGTGNWGNAIIISLGVFFQLLLMVADAVKHVPLEYMDIAKSQRVSRVQRLRFFILPVAAPALVDALRINFGLAWATLVFAEMLGASSGLGYDILRSQRFLLVSRVFFIIITIGTLGIIIDKLFIVLYRKAFPWVEDVRKGGR